MKKLFSLFAAFLFVGSMFGAEATWPGSTALPGTYTAINNDANVKIMTSSTNTYTNPIRVYANTTISIKAADGYTLSSVTYEASSTGNYVTYAQNATVTPSVTPTVSGKNVTWTFSSATQTFTFKPSSQTRSNSITVAYISSTPSAVDVPSISGTTKFSTSTNVTITCSTQGAAIYYTTNSTAGGQTPTTESPWIAYSSALDLTETTTIYAAAKVGSDWSTTASKTFTKYPIVHAGTAENPYTVADAHNAVLVGGDLTDKYVEGIISQVDSYNSTYGSITYWISDDGETTNQFEVYGGLGLSGAPFSSKDDLAKGYEVVVKGELTDYQGTHEFKQNNELVSLVKPAVPTITADPSEVTNVSAEGVKEQTIELEYANITNYLTEATVHPNADGTGTPTPAWLTASVSDADDYATVTYSVSANDGAARTAYIKVYAIGDDDKEATIIIPVSQVKYEGPASLPFAFDGGVSELESTDGMSQNGLGSDYTSSPKLKFNDAADYVIIQIDAAPGTLTYDIKGNSFSGGTFKVQQSADGTAYSDVATYTSLGDKQSETKTLAEATRYIKFIYTNKSNGNVALGNIAILEKGSGPGIITPDPTSIAVPAAGEANGSIAVSYANIGDMTNVENVELYNDAAHTSAFTGGWLTAAWTDDTKTTIAYTVSANTGTPRTAYIYLYAIDDNGDDVEKVIEVSQAKSNGPASLPFAFNGGKDDIANVVGISQENLGSDYASAPVLRFDVTGANIVIYIASHSKKLTLTYDIKGNSYDGSTYKVQESADGSAYTDVATYTSIDSKTQSETKTLVEATRYIKFIYTEKSSGNVALGNIAISDDTGTALDNTEVEGKAVKLLRNGILLIEKNGHTYNAMGQLVK